MLWLLDESDGLAGRQPELESCAHARLTVPRMGADSKTEARLGFSPACICNKKMLRQEHRAKEDPKAQARAFDELHLCTATDLARLPMEGTAPFLFYDLL